MARPRVIDQDDILDAAEAVVLRDGAARLTLDAVAAEAGVSKGSVIYDYKSKHALIKALVERRVAEERGKLEAAIDRLGTAPNSHIKARIATLAQARPDDMQAVSMQLCSALAQDAGLRSCMQAALRQQFDAALATAVNPRAALLAFLAVEGLRTLEFLGFLSWPEPQRAAILQDIERLVDRPLDAMTDESPPVRPPGPPQTRH